MIDQLLWGPDDTVSEAVRRGRTYILVESLSPQLILDQFTSSQYNAVLSRTCHVKATGRHTK